MNAQFNPYPMQSFYQPVNYPGLKTISVIFQVFAILVFAASLVGAIVIFFTISRLWAIGLAVLVTGIVYALILLAIAELFKVFADISISTRATLNQVIDANIRKAETENKQ